MRLKHPCSPECDRRSGICHSVCEEWKRYEEERNKRYEEKRDRIEAEVNSYSKGKRKRGW